MKAALKYRTFDELLDSVKIDLSGIDLEGMIEPQSLIKRALYINKQLGIKVQQRKRALVEVYRGLGKLPMDFSHLSFALLCTDKHSEPLSLSKSTNVKDNFGDGTMDSLIEQIRLIYGILGIGNVRQQVITRSLTPGVNVIEHEMNTVNLVVQLRAQDGTLLFADFTSEEPDRIIVDYQGSVTLPGVQIILIGNVLTTNAGVPIIEAGADPGITYLDSQKQHRYNKLISLNITDHITGPDFTTSEYSISIKDKHLHTNFEEGDVYIEYTSLMEDEQRNLLVLDHELVNNWYEYALKELIFENMFLNNEPNLERRMQLIAQKLDFARTEAISFIRTPDFKDLKNMHDMNRKAMYHKYYNMFK